LKQFVNGFETIVSRLSRAGQSPALTCPESRNSGSDPNGFNEFGVTFSTGSTRPYAVLAKAVSASEFGDALKFMNFQIVMHVGP